MTGRSGAGSTRPRVPFSFQVAAGDDVTESIDVAVVPPPVLEKTAVRMIAPAYTGLKSMALAQGSTQVRAVEGSRIEFEGTTNKPLASARLWRGDSLAKEAVKIEADGVRISTAFAVGTSQPFWVELKDTEGFSGQEVVRFDIRALKDEAPRVTIDEPSHDRDVPAEATVPITDRRSMTITEFNSSAWSTRSPRVHVRADPTTGSSPSGPGSRRKRDRRVEDVIAPPGGSLPLGPVEPERPPARDDRDLVLRRRPRLR